MLVAGVHIWYIGEMMVTGKDLSECQSVQHKPHTIALESNLGLNSAKLMTISLSYDMAFYDINHTSLH